MVFWGQFQWPFPEAEVLSYFSRLLLAMGFSSVSEMPTLGAWSPAELGEGGGRAEDGQLGSGVGGRAWLLWAFRAGRAQRYSLKSRPPRKAWRVWHLSGPPRTGLLAHQLQVCISLRGFGDRDGPQGERSSKECWRGLQTLEDQRGGIKLPDDIKSQHTSRGLLPRPLGRVVCVFLNLGIGIEKETQVEIKLYLHFFKIHLNSFLIYLCILHSQKDIYVCCAF